MYTTVDITDSTIKRVICQGIAAAPDRFSVNLGLYHPTNDGSRGTLTLVLTQGQAGRLIYALQTAMREQHLSPNGAFSTDSVG